MLYDSAAALCNEFWYKTYVYLHIYFSIFKDYWLVI